MTDMDDEHVQDAVLNIADDAVVSNAIAPVISKLLAY